MQCAESLRVQAYFDREVDAVSAAEIERHVEHCNECRELLQDLEKVRSALRSGISYASAPPALRAQVLQALDREPDVAGGDEAIRSTTPRKPRPAWHQKGYGGRGFRIGAFSGIGGAALAAAMAFFLVLPTLSPLSNEIVSAHVRSLMPAHLIDVVSTDKHTVKPWFAGHADVSPAVADFEPQGYRLIGGRADYIDHQRSAVVVYQHGAHVINVFTWAANGTRLPGNTTRSGYHLAFWQQGDIQYCAVSDTGWDELLGLVRLLREQA
ncbi:MAG TPA: zf-HC2 domain-containing protein [Steroidobacteraceae bacterium]|nr:zf-HC2 domain-containing protein [Steroidobacteraceae bacterium]